MPNQELLSFVQESLRAGKSINDIQLELVTSGWQADDIQDVLQQVSSQSSPQDNSKNPGNFLNKFNKLRPIIRNLRIVIPILIFFIFLIGSVSIYSLSRKSQQKSESKPQNTSQRSGFGSLLSKSSDKDPLAASKPSYRIYLKTVPIEGRRVTYQLSLISPDSKLVKTIDTKYQLVLKASFKNMWFFGETFTSCVGFDDYDRDNMTKNCNYWILHSDGRFEKVAESFNKELVHGLGGSFEIKHFFPVSDQEVLYQQCNNADGCKIIKVNPVTGQKQDIPLKGDYKFFDIQGVNPYLGKVYLKDLFPRSEQEYLDKIFHLLTVDLKSGQVVDEALKGVSSYYNKYWISPNGKYIAYVVDAENKIEIYDVEKKQNHTVKLPKGWVTSSLGGNTLPTPIWSPDGSKFLFDSYFVPPNATDMRASKGSVAYIDVKSWSYLKIYEVDIEKDIIDNEKTKGDYHHQLNGLGWFDNNIAQFTLYRYDNRETNIMSVNNYEFKTETKKLQELPSEYGQLLGLYYF